MTRNVFLGADLSPVIGATSIPRKPLDGAGVIWNEPQSTKSAERAAPLAREIKRSKADLVGLQEVALWRKQTPSDGGAPPISPIPTATPATEVAFDFLALLRRELRRAGAKYKVVVVQNEFEAELPVDEDGSDATGWSLLGFGAEFDARLTMRDVILVRTGSKVKLGKTPQGGTSRRGTSPTWVASRSPSIAAGPRCRGQHQVGFSGRKAKTRRFRFVDTHLEAFGDPTIREAQAKELTKGPLKTALAGDPGRRSQLGHRAAQRARAARRRSGLQGAGRLRHARQRCGSELLLRPACSTRPRSSTTRSTTSSASPGSQTPQGVRHGQRSHAEDRVRPLAVRSRRSRQHGAAEEVGRSATRHQRLLVPGRGRASRRG